MKDDAVDVVTTSLPNVNPDVTVELSPPETPRVLEPKPNPGSPEPKTKVSENFQYKV